MASALNLEVIAVAGIALAVIYLAQKAGGAVVDTVKENVKYVDPTSSDNLAYQGASSLARWLAGREDGTLGDIWYDYVHKAEPDPVTGQPMNYTKEQQEADLKAIRQLEAGYHGM